MAVDSVLIIAFGGPEKQADVRPFLENVLKGRRVAPQRMEEVSRHYELIGWASPLNAITFKQAEALQSLLKKNNSQLKVYVGMRNWNPYIADTLKVMRQEGRKRPLVLILAPHRCLASWDRYQQNVADSNDQTTCAYNEPWHNHPLFINAIVERIKECYKKMPQAEAVYTPWIFTAHSIPLEMDQASGYSRQIEETARLVARSLNHSRWFLAYQSRSGRPDDPWLEPDVRDKIKTLAKEKIKSVLLIPIGFVCDHVEVLYDLDVEAKQTAQECGVRYARAQTVSDHPLFIRMLYDLVLRA